MNVKLIEATPLWVVANAIRYSHNNHHLSDSYSIQNNLWDKDIKFPEPTCYKCGETLNSEIGEPNWGFYCSKCEKYISPDNHIGKKDFNLIKRVGFHMNHSSTLEHTILVFDIELSTKALLEDTRHRIGIARTVVSSRYSLKTYDIKFESTKDEWVNKHLDYWHKIINEGVQRVINKETTMDDLAMMLPQSFIYKMQEAFNLRSLIHYLELRTSKAAHKTIRQVAIEILNVLKDKEPMYFELLMENETIKDNYISETADLESYRRPRHKIVKVGNRK